jgi:hypothetical protein
MTNGFGGNMQRQNDEKLKKTPVQAEAAAKRQPQAGQVQSDARGQQTGVETTVQFTDWASI